MGAYTLFDASSQTYLALTSNNNKLHSVASADTDQAKWTITIDGQTATICNKQYDRYIRYNSSSPRFACYASGQQAVALYMRVEGGTDIHDVPAGTGESVDVYNMEGMLVRKNVLQGKALEGLPKGIYVIKGNKVLVK